MILLNPLNKSTSKIAKLPFISTFSLSPFMDLLHGMIRKSRVYSVKSQKNQDIEGKGIVIDLFIFYWERGVWEWDSNVVWRFSVTVGRMKFHLWCWAFRSWKHLKTAEKFKEGAVCPLSLGISSQYWSSGFFKLPFHCLVLINII